MRGYTRHQLKQDRFAEATKETVSWAVEHQKKLVTGGIIAGVVVLVVLGTWYYLNYREQQAGATLAQAFRTYQAPLRPANMPPDANMLSFTSAADRSKVSNVEFRKVADNYPHTNSGRIARYFAGITYRDMGDMPAAERELNQVTGSGNKDLASLAKLALAGIYRDTGREKEAISLYNDLMSHPTDSVAKSTAQLELGELYQTKQPQEARRIYEEIRKEDPASAAAQMATNRLSALK